MVYMILRLKWNAGVAAVSAMVIMTAIELFQLTLIPARLMESSHVIIRVAARLMGTQFSLLDLLAYAVGIGLTYVLDLRISKASETSLKYGRAR